MEEIDLWEFDLNCFLITFLCGQGSYRVGQETGKDISVIEIVVFGNKLGDCHR